MTRLASVKMMIDLVKLVKRICCSSNGWQVIDQKKSQNEQQKMILKMLQTVRLIHTFLVLKPVI